MRFSKWQILGLMGLCFFVSPLVSVMAAQPQMQKPQNVTKLEQAEAELKGVEQAHQESQVQLQRAQSQLSTITKKILPGVFHPTNLRDAREAVATAQKKEQELGIQENKKRSEVVQLRSMPEVKLWNAKEKLQRVKEDLLDEQDKLRQMSGSKRAPSNSPLKIRMAQERTVRSLEETKRKLLEKVERLQKQVSNPPNSGQQ